MNPIAPYSFSAVSQAMGAIASLIPAWLVYQSYKKHQEDFIKYFIFYFLFIGIGGLILATVEFTFPLDVIKQGIGVLFSVPFFYLSSAYFFMIPASLKFPKLKNIGFGVIIAMGLVSFVLSIIDIHPTVIDERGLISFDSSKYVGGLFF